jgi:hypothetical protein
MLNRPAFLAALLCLALPMAADAQQSAQPAAIPPLSQYGSLRSPPLSRAGLTQAVRRAVDAAIAAAAEASGTAARAEGMVQTAQRAADRGRKAARRAEARDIVFGNTPCRYSGEMIGRRAQGDGVMICDATRYEGQFQDGMPDGLIVVTGPEGGYLGQFRRGKRDGLGGDYQTKSIDAYEGTYRNGERIGFGIERDRDGFYPGRYGFYADQQNGRRVNMELLGLQNFRGSHWAGTYGAYSGPRIACTLIKGAVLEGSVLDGIGAKFDADGKVIEQGRYRVGILENGAGPPC